MIPKILIFLLVTIAAIGTVAIADMIAGEIAVDSDKLAYFRAVVLLVFSVVTAGFMEFSAWTKLFC